MKNNVLSLLAICFLIGILVVEFTPNVGSVEMIGKEKQPFWHFGEGLKPGDSFEYKICDYLLKIPESPDNCYVITLDVVALLPSLQGNVWVMSAHVDHRVRNVDFILHVSDSSFEMTTDGLSISYADSLERTLEWVMEFASNHKPQPLVIGKSWGVVASDVVPETKLTVLQADSVQMESEIIPTYKIGYSLVQDSFLQIKDGFPMPIKAILYKPVSIFKDIPLAMTFELLRYDNGGENLCVPQTGIFPVYSNMSLFGKPSMPNLLQNTELPVNFTGLNSASKNTDSSKGNDGYNQMLIDGMSPANLSGGNDSDIETEYFDESDFHDQLENSTTAQILKDLYGPDYERIITSFDKFVELLTNTTNALKNHLDSTLP